MSNATTPGQRAHLRLRELLAQSTRTHRAKPPIERRGKNMTFREAVSRARNGRRNGPQARLRKPMPPST